MNLKILHVTPSFYPATYWGGPIYSVYGLCNALAKIPDVSLRVLTTDSADPNRSDSVEVSGFPMYYPAGFEVFFCRRLWAASVSPGMILQLWSMIRWADIIHLTGVYSFPTFPVLLLARINKKPVVWSPRGALQRWKGSKRLFLKYIWERVCNFLIMPGLCTLHVTSDDEAKESLQRISRADIVVIPNGVEIPELTERNWRPDSRLRLLYLGRLHPKKGIENLIRCMMELKEETLLNIYGNGEQNYTNQLKELIISLGLENRIFLRGHVTGVKKKLAFENSDLSIVPSFTENFGMVVAESLAHGVPVIASKGTPWEKLEKKGCGFWVDNDPLTLKNVIIRTKQADLFTMGLKGRKWMIESYSWGSVSNRMFRLYENILSQ